MPTSELVKSSEGAHVGIEKGTFNHCVGFIGVPGTGKSTAALAFAVQLARKSRAYLVAHDVGWRLPERWPGGGATGIIRHESITSARAAMGRDPRGAHCLATGDASAVISLGREVAQASLSRGGGRLGFPVVVLVDEAVAMSSSHARRLGDDLRDLMTGRRHLNVGLVWTCQMARLCHYSMIALGTEMHLFRVVHHDDLRRLGEGSISDDHLAILPTLPNYKRVVVKMS